MACPIDCYTVKPLLCGPHGPGGAHITKKMPVTEKYVYCVYSHVPNIFQKVDTSTSRQKSE